MTARSAAGRGSRSAAWDRGPGGGSRAARECSPSEPGPARSAGGSCATSVRTAAAAGRARRATHSCGRRSWRWRTRLRSPLPAPASTRWRRSRRCCSSDRVHADLGEQCVGGGLETELLCRQPRHRRRRHELGAGQRVARGVTGVGDQAEPDEVGVVARDGRDQDVGLGAVHARRERHVDCRGGHRQDHHPDDHPQALADRLDVALKALVLLPRAQPSFARGGFEVELAHDAHGKRVERARMGQISASWRVTQAQLAPRDISHGAEPGPRAVIECLCPPPPSVGETVLTRRWRNVPRSRSRHAHVGKRIPPASDCRAVA